MKKHLILFTAHLLLFSATVFAQTSIQLTRYSMLNFRISSVFDINILNATSQVKSGYLSGKIVKAENNETVAEVLSTFITLQPGLNVLNSSAINKTFSYYDNYAQASDKTGIGAHQVCVTFTESSGIEPASVECITLTPPTYSLPYLVYPYHESTIGNKHPNLMWTAALTGQGQEVKYKLELTELFPGQQPNDAIINNYKLIQTDFLSANSLFFPSTADELMYGKFYAWQVSTYIGGILAGKTEVWSFNLVNDTPSVTEEIIPLNYIILSDVNLEGIYTAKDKKLFIELDEKYVYGNVMFTIYEDESLKKQVCEIEEKRKTGSNLYTLTLSSCEKDLNNNRVYYLAVNSNNKMYKLKFRINP